jgi:hypothetical protein
VAKRRKTTGMILLITIVIRLLVPVSILRWPLAGTVLSLLADNFDNYVLRTYGWGFLPPNSYQEYDKFLDIYYLSFAFYASSGLRESFTKKTLQILFFWRFAGVLLFEVTNTRSVLFFAPNIFEYFFFFVYAAKRFFPRVDLNSRKTVLAAVALIAVPKFAMEYVMHVMEYPLSISTFIPFLNEHVFK